MEIRIKTAEEFHADHVTIEIVDGSVSSRLYTADEVGHYQATEAELVAEPIRRRVTELEKENQSLALRVCEFDRDRHTEKNRADVNRATVVHLAGRVRDLINQVKDCDRDQRTERDQVGHYEANEGYHLGQISKLRGRVAELDRDRRTEKDRAIRERQRASELKDRLSLSEERVRGERARADANHSRVVALAPRVRDLTDQVKDYDIRANDLAERLAEVKKERDNLATRVVELEKSLVLQKESRLVMAAKHDQSLKLRDEEVEQRIKARDNLVQQANAQIRGALEILRAQDVINARSPITSHIGQVMSQAIGDAIVMLEG